jgi:hypothetical protein
VCSASTTVRKCVYRYGTVRGDETHQAARTRRWDSANHPIPSALWLRQPPSPSRSPWLISNNRSLSRLRTSTRCRAPSPLMETLLPVVRMPACWGLMRPSRLTAMLKYSVTRLLRRSIPQQWQRLEFAQGPECPPVQRYQEWRVRMQIALEARRMHLPARSCVTCHAVAITFSFSLSSFPCPQQPCSLRSCQCTHGDSDSKPAECSMPSLSLSLGAQDSDHELCASLPVHRLPSRTSCSCSGPGLGTLTVRTQCRDAGKQLVLLLLYDERFN